MKKACFENGIFKYSNNGNPLQTYTFGKGVRALILFRQKMSK